MRCVIYGGACSLDGYIAGPRDEVDWLSWTEDVAAISNALWQRIDTVVMGRRTYEVAVRGGNRSYPGVANIVFSRTLSPPDWPEIEVVTEDAVSFMRRIKYEEGGDICVMGGGQLAGSLMAAGLIDEIGVNIQPIVLGRGIPLLRGLDRRISLELLEARVLTGGCVYALYRVVDDAASDGAVRQNHAVG